MLIGCFGNAFAATEAMKTIEGPMENDQKNCMVIRFFKPLEYHWQAWRYRNLEGENKNGDLLPGHYIA